MSKLPPDPTAHMDATTSFEDEQIRYIVQYLVDRVLHLDFGTDATGVHIGGDYILRHILLKITRELSFHGGFAYLASIGTKGRPFDEVYRYIIKLSVLMGGRQFEARFSALLQQLTARYRGNTAERFAVSVSPPPGTRPQPTPPPRPQIARGSRSTSFPFELIEPACQEVRFPSSSARVNSNEDLMESLSLRTMEGMTPIDSHDMWFMANPFRSLIRSRDPDVIHEICRFAEEKEILLELPVYTFRGKDRKFFISALRAIVKMSFRRKNDLPKLVADLKFRTSCMAQGQKVIPNIVTVSLFLATMNSPNPDVFVASVEIAAFIFCEGITKWEELMVVMASRCLPSLPEEGDLQWQECLIDGWKVHIKEPMKKEGSE